MAKLRPLSPLEFKYNSDIFRFVSVRGVQICITSLGKLIFNIEKLKIKIMFSVVVWGSLASVKPLLTTLCAYNKGTGKLTVHAYTAIFNC